MDDATKPASRTTAGVAYAAGFGNEHTSEAVPGALPVGQNSPQRPPLGLYAEQISGTAFTAPRAVNRRSWFYRIRPSVCHGTFSEHAAGDLLTSPCADARAVAAQLSWNPFPIPPEPCDFFESWHTVALNGDCRLQVGLGIHVYLATESRTDRYFFDADGELLFVPQQGRLRFRTEMGVLEVEPGEICVVQRGIKFGVDLLDGPARGYIAENYGSLFGLPELGPIGSNSLANARDFMYPTARFEDGERECELWMKASGRLFRSRQRHSPLDVVAWHGNYAPYKYDLRRFNAIGTVSYDHPDPSIYTVLTARSDTPGVANADFVIFPPRWMVAEHTFRPPWYHRNAMSEFMGLVYGVYDAKPGSFMPGGASLHNGMIAHGPSDVSFAKASAAELRPTKQDDTMAFMVESRFPYLTTPYAMESGALDDAYSACWSGLKRHFPKRHE
ncbi:MAG TPA: homogentisate 1,2-dioxygenase [Candidatus Binataceae bacterium]|nr:homogentisate 1,2-dioxygenase [Candidatus Binataceae bacterium]